MISNPYIEIMLSPPGGCFPSSPPATSYFNGRSASAIAEGRRTQRMTLTGFAIIGIVLIIALP